jgi:mono/diheme cytochrome c family protein
MYRVSVAAIVVALACVAGCPSPNAERVARVTALTPDVDNGQALYDTHCVTCHGADGRSGTANKDTVDYATNNEGVFFDYVIDGDPGMPGFGDTFTDQELADVWGYVQSL